MVIFYTTEDGRSQIKLRAKDQTVWLSQREMSQLFDVSTDNVGLHLKNIFGDGELSPEATTEESSVVQIEGSREVQRPVTLYNLDAILAVGLPGALAAWRAVPPLGLHHPEGIPAQGLHDGRRAHEEPGWPPGLLRRDAGAHPGHPGLREALLPEGARPFCLEHRLRQDRQGHADFLRHGAESFDLRGDPENRGGNSLSRGRIPPIHISACSPGREQRCARRVSS